MTDLFDGFDPSINNWDRRLFFEVVGLKLPSIGSAFGSRTPNATRAQGNHAFDETPEEEFFKRTTSLERSVTRKANNSAARGSRHYSKIDLDEFNNLMGKLIEEPDEGDSSDTEARQDLGGDSGDI